MKLKRRGYGRRRSTLEVSLSRPPLLGKRRWKSRRKTLE